MMAAPEAKALRQKRRSQRRKRLRRWLVGLGLGLALLTGALFWFWEGRGERLFYPLKFEETIVTVSREAGVEPSLVAGLILAESGFKSEARSCVGAIGLMQLMPPTAQWVAELHSLPFDAEEPQSLYDPELNIYLGSYYLAWLLERFQQQKVEALAAYNAGQHQVDEWLERGSVLRIEEIPVAETRFFVQRVLDNQEEYWKLYPQLRPNGGEYSLWSGEYGQKE